MMVSISFSSVISAEKLTVFWQLIIFKISSKINFQIITEIGKLYHSIVIDRNAILSAFFLCQHFFLTVSINLLCALSLGTLAKSFQIF